MKQPRINGRQARWLIYLTPYDFIIRHRPGLLNPADGPSRRPDYLAQKGPSPEQDNLLASRLVGSNSDLSKAVKLSKAAGPDLPLQDIAKCQDMAIQFPLQKAVKCQLCEVAKMADLPLCKVAKCQLCEVAKMAIPCPLGDTTVDFRLCDTADLHST